MSDPNLQKAIDDALKAMDSAWKLLGAVEQNPRRRYMVAGDREKLWDAMRDLRAATKPADSAPG